MLQTCPDFVLFTGNIIGIFVLFKYENEFELVTLGIDDEKVITADA